MRFVLLFCLSICLSVSQTVSGSSPFLCSVMQHGAPGPVPFSPFQRSALERAVSTTVRPGIESEPTALLSSLYESEVHRDSCVDIFSSFRLLVSLSLCFDKIKVKHFLFVSTEIYKSGDSDFYF